MVLGSIVAVLARKKNSLDLFMYSFPFELDSLNKNLILQILKQNLYSMVLRFTCFKVSACLKCVHFMY